MKAKASQEFKYYCSLYMYFFRNHYILKVLHKEGQQCSQYFPLHLKMNKRSCHSLKRYFHTKYHIYSPVTRNRHAAIQIFGNAAARVQITFLVELTKKNKYRLWCVWSIMNQTKDPNTLGMPGSIRPTFKDWHQGEDRYLDIVTLNWS